MTRYSAALHFSHSQDPRKYQDGSNDTDVHYPHAKGVMLSADSICYYRSPCKEHCCYHAQDLSLSNGAYPASKCRDRDRCTAAGLDVTRRAPFHRTRAQIYRKLRRSIQISFRAVTCKPAVIRAPLHAEKAHTHDAVSLHDFLFCYA